MLTIRKHCAMVSLIDKKKIKSLKEITVNHQKSNLYDDSFFELQYLLKKQQ